METAFDAVHGWIVWGADLAIRPLRGVDVRLLLAGLALQVLGDAVRTRGWFTILRAAFADTSRLRWRDVMAASFAGGGVNAVVPARGGDLLKLALIRRRLEDARPSTLLTTLAPETLFELAAGITLLGWAAWHGYLPLRVGMAGALLDHPLTGAALGVGAVLALAGLWWLLRRRARGLSEHLAAGLTILKRPRMFLLGVASWQALGRMIRLGSLCCLLAAFKLPAAPAAAALVMAVEGATQIRFAGATTALRAGLLLYGLPRAGGAPVEAAAVVAYLLGARLACTLAALTLSAAALIAHIGTASPRRAWALARRALEPAPETTRV